jgi:hypothetical protein
VFAHVPSHFHPSLELFSSIDKPKLAPVGLKNKENVRFGQAVFSPRSDNVIYATGTHLRWSDIRPQGMLQQT